MSKAKKPVDPLKALLIQAKSLGVEKREVETLMRRTKITAARKEGWANSVLAAELADTKKMIDEVFD